jgi:hypothetical protein
MTLSQWILGATASLVIAVIAAFFRAEMQLACWQTGLVVVAALGTGTYGVYRLWELRSVHRQFVAALGLFCELKRIRPFLVRYREEIR